MNPTGTADQQPGSAGLRAKCYHSRHTEADNMRRYTMHRAILGVALAARKACDK